MSWQKERPEGFVEKIWSFVPTFGTVSPEMKHTQLIGLSYTNRTKNSANINPRVLSFYQC